MFKILPRGTASEASKKSRTFKSIVPLLVFFLVFVTPFHCVAPFSNTRVMGGSPSEVVYIINLSKLIAYRKSTFFPFLRWQKQLSHSTVMAKSLHIHLFSRKLFCSWLESSVTVTLHIEIKRGGKQWFNHRRDSSAVW